MAERTGPVEVVVVGSVGVDTNVYLGEGGVDFGRESNFTTNVDYVGQAGGYATRGFAQLGRRTAFVGHVGDDHSGAMIREAFARDGVDTRGLFVDPAGTCRSVNLVEPDGRRKNFYDGKSHMSLRPDQDACRAILDGARLVHFNIPNWARYVLPLARDAGATISCDLQDVVSLGEPYRADFVEHADVLFFSAVNLADPEAAIAEMLRTKPSTIVVVGMGARGCAVGAGGSVRRFEAIAAGEPVVDTNGAGDGLAVGFLTSYVLDGYGLEAAIRRGQIAARHTCARAASTDDLITPALLDARDRALAYDDATERMRRALEE
jgi:sugar/nucleoside kinase (ribokinase family)